MKKFMILVTIIMAVSLTACGSKEGAKVSKPNGLATNVSDCMRYEEIAFSSVIFIHNEEEFEEYKNEEIAYIEENWEEEGLPSEECKDELVQLVQALEYNPNLVNGYDLDSLQISMINVLVKYDVLPDECMNKTADEAEEIMAYYSEI